MTSSPTGADRRARRRAGGRIAVAGVLAALLLGWGGGVAWAHVTVNPSTVTAGSYAKLTFRVPAESATASTVSVRVTLPSAHPFPSVSVMQIPGWTAHITKTPLDPPLTQGRFTLTEAVTGITWTADDGVGIQPEEFMEFAISAGPVPDVPSMQFPTVQTYSDGSVVRWDQPPTAGAGAPEHPAPMLTIAAAGVTGAPTAGAGAGAGPTVTGADQPHPSTVTPSSGDLTARILGVCALVLAALALVVAALGLRRNGGGRPSRRPHGPPPPPEPAP